MGQWRSKRVGVRRGGALLFLLWGEGLPGKRPEEDSMGGCWPPVQPLPTPQVSISVPHPSAGLGGDQSEATP